jgi:H+-transporting ATPase
MKYAQSIADKKQQQIIAAEIAQKRLLEGDPAVPNETEVENTHDGIKHNHEEDESGKNFIYSKGLTSEEAADLLAKFGRNELPEKKTPKWLIFCQQLYQPMPCMIWAAVIVEAAIENFLDMGILIGINFANASIAYYELTKAADAVDELKKSLQAFAMVVRDGKVQKIEAALLVPGDLIQLNAGAAIPADCRVNEKEIEVDQAALTGESMPVPKFKGDECLMGSNVVKGEVDGTVTATGENTFFGKTAALLGGDVEMSNLQNLLISIVSILTGVSVILCIIVFVYLISVTNVVESLSFTIVVLVASIPMAIEIVTTSTLALGSKELSSQGAIVSKLAAIEDMAGMSILCSDKTGTLTQNKMVIQEETPIYVNGNTQFTLLRYAAMAAKWKEPPKDALDTLVLNCVDKDSLNSVQQVDYAPFDPIIKRTEATLVENSKQFKTTKGAPHIILKLVIADGAQPGITEKVEEDVHQLGMRGIRSLAVAKTNESNKWEFLGLLTFLDPPRFDTKETIAKARQNGVMVKMITGDHYLIAKETARVLDLGSNIKGADDLPLLDPVTKKKPKNLKEKYGDLCLTTDGFSQVYPEHKFLIVECLREMGYKVGMTGDGVNDAPALKRADVGVAVNGATDAARAAASIILTQDGLSTIIDGIIISRRIFKRIKNFLVYRIAATLQLLCFFFIAVFWFKPKEYMPHDWQIDPNFPDTTVWPEFFHMPVLMLMLITLLNDGTLISIGYDNVEPSHAPDKWNRRAMFTIASVLAVVALISSLLLLGLLLNSWHPNSLMARWGIGYLSYGQVTTSIYLKISISDFLTLFSARTGDDWFCSSKPASILVGAGAIALSISTILACAWPQSSPDGIATLGLGLAKPYALAVYIWIYCIVWWFIQDACKVLVARYMAKINLFGVNENGTVVFSESALKFIEDDKKKGPSKFGH